MAVSAAVSRRVYRAIIAGVLQRPATMMAAMSKPEAARSWAMPTRGEWVEMSAGSMPAAFAAALRRRATVLWDRSNTNASGPASAGLICLSAFEANWEMGAYAP